MTLNPQTPLTALNLALAKPGAATKDDLAIICFSEFGKRKWTELTERQQWTLVCIVDSDCVGPYGSSMKNF
jgi:hypothetical protein